MYGTPEHVEPEPQQQILRIFCSKPSCHHAPGLDDVGCILDAGRHVGAHVSDAGAGLVGDEFIGAEVDAEALGIVGVAPGGAGEIAERGAVLGCDLAEVAGPDHAARAIHVLNEDAGMAVDVLGQMLCKQPALDIGRPTGGEVDDEGQPLAFEEWFVGRARRAVYERRAEPEKGDRHA